MRITVLGCGSSGGVPRIGNDWGACDPAEPRNRRRRASILIEQNGRHLLVDTAPDLRQQLLDAGVGRLDGVVWTHDHADHSHGIDELRAAARHSGGRVAGFADGATVAALRRRFGYVIDGDAAAGYPPVIDLTVIEGPFQAAGLEVIPFRQSHGAVHSLGLRVGRFAYSTDVNRLDDAAFAALAGVEVWMVGTLGSQPHPTHAHVDLALDWAARVKPRRLILTHLSDGLDYRALAARLPAWAEPAHDGQVIQA